MLAHHWCGTERALLFKRTRLEMLVALGIALASVNAVNAQTAAVAPFPAPSPLAQPTSTDSAVSTATPAPNAPGDVLPGGTTVTVSLSEPLSSSTAQVDDQIAIVVKKPVVVHGILFIPQGANGHATVTAAEHSSGNGSGGKLAITIDWVYAVDGGKIKLSQTNHASETGDSKGASSTATIATYLLLGPLGLFAHNFVHGRDVSITTKQNFVVFVDHEVHLSGQAYTGPTAESTPR
jgi:hypothetical protein